MTASSLFTCTGTRVYRPTCSVYGESTVDVTGLYHVLDSIVLYLAIVSPPHNRLVGAVLRAQVHECTGTPVYTCSVYGESTVDVTGLYQVLDGIVLYLAVVSPPHNRFVGAVLRTRQRRLTTHRQ